MRLSPDETQVRFLTYLRDVPSASALSDFANDFIKAIAVAETGDVDVTGATHSGNRFPTTPRSPTGGRAGAVGSQAQPPSGGSGEPGDVFVTRLNATGTALVYSTFLGGSQPRSAGQIGLGLAVDASGRAYVTGQTSSSDFPTVAPYQAQSVNPGSDFPPGYDGFLSRVSADGTALDSSTYLSGSEVDWATALVLDSTGTVWLTGFTDSADFPTTPDAVQSTNGGVQSGFLSAFMLPDPLLWIDVPASGNVTAPFLIWGWAIDRAATTDAGIDAVHIWAYPDPGSGAAPVFLGAPTLGAARSDVGGVFGPQFANAGLNLTLDSLAADHLPVAFGHSTITGTFLCRCDPTHHADSRPVLTIDVPAQGATPTSPLFIAGWAIDRGAASGPGIDTVHVWSYPNPGVGSAGGVRRRGGLRREPARRRSALRWQFHRERLRTDDPVARARHALARGLRPQHRHEQLRGGRDANRNDSLDRTIEAHRYLVKRRSACHHHPDKLCSVERLCALPVSSRPVRSFVQRDRSPVNHEPGRAHPLQPGSTEVRREAVAAVSPPPWS